MRLLPILLILAIFAIASSDAFLDHFREKLKQEADKIKKAIQSRTNAVTTVAADTQTSSPQPGETVPSESPPADAPQSRKRRSAGSSQAEETLPGEAPPVNLPH